MKIVDRSEYSLYLEKEEIETLKSAAKIIKELVSNMRKYDLTTIVDDECCCDEVNIDMLEETYRTLVNVPSVHTIC